MPQSLSQLQRATYQSVVDGPARTDPALRRRVAVGQPPVELAALVRKIRDHAYKVTDGDVDALRVQFSEDQLFELVIAAAIGAADDRLEAALEAVAGA